MHVMMQQQHCNAAELDEQPVSRTYQYRKVRVARIQLRFSSPAGVPPHAIIREYPPRAQSTVVWTKSVITRFVLGAQVMKPLLERKRRARINRCLDELKDLMVVTLQAEGENVSKLEKADILELTVRHLQKLKRHNALGLTGPDSVYADRFRAGFAHCAAEVSNYLTSDARAPPVDPSAGVKLLRHLGACMRKIDVDTTTTTTTTTNTAPAADHQQYNRPYTPPSTPGSDDAVVGLLKPDDDRTSACCWRPW